MAPQSTTTSRRCCGTRAAFARNRGSRPRWNTPYARAPRGKTRSRTCRALRESPACRFLPARLPARMPRCRLRSPCCPCLSLRLIVALLRPFARLTFSSDRALPECSHLRRASPPIRPRSPPFSAGDRRSARAPVVASGGGVRLRLHRRATLAFTKKGVM